jgi:hypothetical protein
MNWSGFAHRDTLAGQGVDKKEAPFDTGMYSCIADLGYGSRGRKALRSPWRVIRDRVMTVYFV